MSLSTRSSGDIVIEPMSPASTIDETTMNNASTAASKVGRVRRSHPPKPSRRKHYISFIGHFSFFRGATVVQNLA